MTAKMNSRQQMISEIRKRVRGIGCVKGVWRLNLEELRSQAQRLLTTRWDWLTPGKRMMLAAFVTEVEG